MIIAKYDKKYQVIYKNSNLRELLRMLEEIAFEFVLQREVQPERYFKKTKSGFYKTHKMGYFAVSSWDKITIFEKYIEKGYIYNSGPKVRKIITYILVRPSFSPCEKEGMWNVDKYLEKVTLFQFIHEELISEVLRKNPLSEIIKEN
jgi:hypothetical protein